MSHTGSTLLRKALWSLFFLLMLSVFASCGDGRVSEDVSLLSSEVEQMRRYQRRADNFEFYIHKYNADKIIERYADNYPSLSEENRRSYAIYRGYYTFTLADYLLQIGKRKEAISELDKLASSNVLNLNSDTLMWLNYLSHQGQIRFIPYRVNENRKDIEKGYDCLVQCYILSSRNNLGFYKSVAMLNLSKYLLNDSVMDIIRNVDPASIRYINEENVSDSMLAGNMAERSLGHFLKSNDFYFTASAWRMLASCYFKIGDVHNSIQCLNNALANPEIDSLPDLKAGILEQLSMSYAAIDDKYHSDLYRNQYLDQQDSTRMDCELEARLVGLKKNADAAWVRLYAALFAFVVLVIAAGVLVKRKRNRTGQRTKDNERLETLQTSIRKLELEHSDSLRAMVEQRARIYVLESIISLIDRMKLAIKKGDYTYAYDLAENIENQNSLLTKWIKLKQGMVTPKIESFPLEDVFSIVRKGINSNSNVQLVVLPSEQCVKADRSLTLFIVNTLIENARKAIDNKGVIKVSCNSVADYVEIAIEDNGKGMTDEQLEHLFEPKPIKKEHGFGLQNCKGIIDSYRKVSSLFSVCSINAQSKVGEGTTIRFRLPLVVKSVILLVMMMFSTASYSETVSDYADSLYNFNVAGRYADAMRYADICNEMIKQDENVPDEIKLSVYNETAVASLALHQWRKYKYYNYLYTSLYKQVTTDITLPEQCDEQDNQINYANLLLYIMIVLVISLFVVFCLVFVVPIIKHRKEIENQLLALEEVERGKKREFYRIHVRNNVINNQLSVIKHETMYYPTRIKQLIRMKNEEELLKTASYYSTLYNMLLMPLMHNDNAQMFPVSKVLLSEIFPWGTNALSDRPENDESIEAERKKEERSKENKELCVLANKDLLEYLKLLFKRQNGGVSPLYVLENNKLVVTMSDNQIEESNIMNLFSLSTIHTDFLVMRQIVREIANSANSYQSGITARVDNGVPKLLINFPTTKTG